MSKHRLRIVGTTEKAVGEAEAIMGFSFPPSFRAWLLENNTKGIEDVTIFPVFDDRDPRKTSDSIVRNFQVSWKEWLQNFDDVSRFGHLLPFGESGTGDFYCFDYSENAEEGEVPVVIGFHETGNTAPVANNFARFVELAVDAELE